MVCYAWPVGRMATIALVVFLVFGKAVGHFLGAAAVAVAITVTAVVAAVALTAALAALGATRRRRAAAGGCVRCRFSCQHPMTEPARHPQLMGIGSQPAAPRWPDRPVYRSGPAPLRTAAPAGNAAQRERT
jgi:hypothetical protein